MPITFNQSNIGLYIEGYSSPQIAELLTQSGIPTVTGLSNWSAGTVLGILRKEKYCGDALCQKAVTVDFFTHKSVKNTGLETQYFIEGHHDPIIDKNDWLLVQQIRKERRNFKRRSKTYKPRYVMKGVLAGFMIVDLNWSIDEANHIIEKMYDAPKLSSVPHMEEDENFVIEKE